MRRATVIGIVATMTALALAGCGSKTATSPPAASVASAPGSTTASSAAALSTTTMPPVMSASSVTQFVTAFYNQYAACHGGRGGPTCTSSVVNEYGTANLDSYYTPAAGYAYSADPITCAQALPGGVEVSDVTLTPNQASGTVTEDFTPSITTMFVVVDQSGTLKIDTITCNPPLVPVKQVTGGGATGSTGGTGTSLDGTYTISLPPGNDGCGTPSLSAETLTVNGTTASITAVSGQTPFHGTATTTGSTFSIHITNGITGAVGSPLAPGAIVIDLTGSIEPNGVLSGQSVNSGVYPGGTNGFGCTSPFTATHTSAKAAPPRAARPPPPPLPVAPPPAPKAAITAAARAVDGANFDGLDTSTPNFGCSGKFAYAFAIVGSGNAKADVTILFMATNGTWQPASRSIYCQNGSVPQPIYQPACETQ